MASPSGQHEPTMEEILASIRKIISEDAPTQPSSASEAGAQDPDVLDLTQVVTEDFPSAPGQGAPSDPPQQEESQAVDAAHEPVHQTSGEATVSQAAAHSSEGIFSDKSRKALNEVFNGLTPPQQPEQIAPVSGLSVESIFERAVRETFEPVLQKWLGENADTIIDRMKPTISEWLDEHFPAMLEEAVRNEVARAVRARGRR